jgi:hypothetical protein
VSGVDALVRGRYFGDVPEESLAAILRAGAVHDVAAGEVVLRPGDDHRSLFLVLEGSLEVRLEEGAGTVSAVAAGECFGEMALVEGRPASAFVVAPSAARVLRVPAERVFAELLPMPGFARGLLRLMSERLRQNLGREASWEQVRKELRVARDIQASMLPPAGVLFPDRPEIDCTAAMEPAAEVGGDFYDAFFVDERYLFFAVGDVAGKGMGAALFMARSLTLLRSESLRRRSLQELLARVNEALVNDQATFVSLFCGVLDCWSGTVRYANGGGLAPWLLAGGRWTRLPMPRGLVVGAMPGFAFESPGAPRPRRRARAVGGSMRGAPPVSFRRGPPSRRPRRRPASRLRASSRRSPRAAFAVAARRRPHCWSVTEVPVGCRARPISPSPARRTPSASDALAPASCAARGIAGALSRGVSVLVVLLVLAVPAAPRSRAPGPATSAPRSRVLGACRRRSARPSVADGLRRATTKEASTLRVVTAEQRLRVGLKRPNPGWRRHPRFRERVRARAARAPAGLREIAYNLRWSWDDDLRVVFSRLDRELWDRTYQNPVLMLGSISQERLEALARDDSFLPYYDRALERLRAYLREPTWWDRRWPERPLVAYFSAEYGIAECLPIYSGGLGVLSGHHLKSASDLGVPLVGVGLLYQQGYFRQYLNSDGWQQESYPVNDFYNVPVQLATGRTARRCASRSTSPEAAARAGLAGDVGRVPLYLLDTNLPENPPDLQDITDQLYGGDHENRIRRRSCSGSAACAPCARWASSRRCAT